MAIVSYDVGANIGFYSFLPRRNSRWVYAVEPVPGYMKQLKRHLSMRFARNVRVVPVALSDKTEKLFSTWIRIQENIINNLSAISIFEKFGFRSCDYAPDRTYSGPPISVETMTFDNLLAEATADLAKVDV